MRKKIKAETVRRIQAVGYLREVDVTELLDPAFQVENNQVHNFVFNWLGGTGIILQLRFTAFRRTRIMEFSELVVAGLKLDVDWWLSQAPNPYLFLGKNAPQFPFDCVVNHRVGAQGLLQPGNPVEGFLLGRCYTSLPRDVCDRLELPAKLSIVAGTGEIHSTELSMTFDHTLNVKPERRKSTLFEPVRGLYRNYDDEPRSADASRSPENVNQERAERDF